MSVAVASGQRAAFAERDYGWIRSASFDYGFTLGATVIALSAGAASVLRPELFPLLLFIDLWMLGYHHVVSTFTRIAFDRDSLAEHRNLVFVLPWLVLAGTLSVGVTLGPWAIATVFLYWQWFHYTRQSYGVLRIYSRKANDLDSFDAKLRNWVLYLVPLWGIAWRSFQAPELYLGAHVMYVPVPLGAVHVRGAASLIVTVLWAARTIYAAMQGRLKFALELYLLTHLAIFAAGYVLISNIDYGWLVLNVWHNVQYILIMWMFNNNRFKNGVDPKQPIFSALCQNHAFNIACYFGVCLGITAMVYSLLHWTLKLTPLAAAPLAALIVYQSINFHHYIVDSKIWKVRKKSIQKTLQVAS
jgi:hypothetical protein